MKKKYSLLLLLIILPLISAVDLDIEQQSSNEVFIKELNIPIEFDLKITNLKDSDTFKFYNLLGFTIDPETIYLKKGESKEIILKIAPIGKLDLRGFYIFKYSIRGKNESKMDKELLFKVIELKDVFEIGSEEFDSTSSSLKIYIKNKVNFNFENINSKFKSPFFEFEENFALKPHEKKSFEVQLNKEEFKKLMAGLYNLNAKVRTHNQETNVEGTLKFVEKNLITTKTKDYGLVIYTKIIEKINEGNVIEKSETVIKKNIISRLFTSLNPEPNRVDRQGLTIYYTWDKELNPGENLEINVKTNWLFPFLIIFFIVTVVVLTKQYVKTNLTMEKKVSFVKAKGGEFALKVSIILNAKKYIEKINVVDKLPPLVKLHEKFSNEVPVKINEKNKRIEWSFQKLEAGETRIISYIIYSKIGVLGKFSLPATTAFYEREGILHETESNRAFFVAEPLKKEERN